jgi:hypothetical protein
VCAELRDLYAQILRGDGLPTETTAVAMGLPLGDATAARSRTRPAQLPAPDGLFLGRAADLAALAEVEAGALVVVSAPGGLGKTALVVEWAHRSAGDFPDGQLWCDLGGGELAPTEAVRAALLALGVTPAGVPAGAADRVGLYRTLLRERQILIVADNAGSEEQVLALLPPGGRSRLVVTSRRRLVSLAAYSDVREIVLAPLTSEVSARLLERIVGSERLAEPGSADLVEWCGGWPLLIRHVGATLAFRLSQSVTSFAHELEMIPGDEVLCGDPRSVGAALESAHASLSAGAAQLFERLALHSGVICQHVAAAVAGTTLERSRRLLDELVGVHLVMESGSGEFRFHDVVARFGRRLAREQEWTTPTWGDGHDVTPSCLECGGSPAIAGALTLASASPTPVPA